MWGNVILRNPRANISGPDFITEFNIICEPEQQQQQKKKNAVRIDLNAVDGQNPSRPPISVLQSKLVTVLTTSCKPAS